MSVDVVRRLFTAEQFFQMIATGILTKHDHVELLEGEILEMTPIGRSHAACRANLIRMFILGIDGRGIVWSPGTIRLSDRSAPQPDLAVLRPNPRKYRDAYPIPDDVLLLVEISDSSLRRDRELKLPMYARAGIQEYWIVDVQDEVVDVYTSPANLNYASARTFRRGEFISPAAFPDLAIAVDDIFD
jgi:Uma2 family endonuclease